MGHKVDKDRILVGKIHTNISESNIKGTEDIGFHLCGNTNTVCNQLIQYHHLKPFHHLDLYSIF